MPSVRLATPVDNLVKVSMESINQRNYVQTIERWGRRCVDKLMEAPFIKIISRVLFPASDSTGDARSIP